MEIKPTGFLSAVASLTPYSDFNQSPRNMYQCQVRNLCSMFQLLVQCVFKNIYFESF